MSYRFKHEKSRVYASAEAWVERALRRDDSLFTPGTRVWAGQWLDELRTRFLDRPDESGDDFFVKLEGQLQSSPPEVYQLAAETLYMHLLITDKITFATKRTSVERLLGWSPQPVAIPQELLDGLKLGLVNPGTAFNTNRPSQFGFIVEFASQWKQLSHPNQERLLRDPWAFRDHLKDLPLESLLFAEGYNWHRTQRLALLHLVHPDSFEPIVSQDHKDSIAKAFEHLVLDPSQNVDHRLLDIRSALEPAHGADFTFYEDDLREKWDPRKPAPSPATPIPDEPPPTSERTGDLSKLAARLNLPTDFLRTIKQLIEHKRQVIFQGPPGTGKTYVAQELANHLADAEKRVTLVQFHPSYAYEDFVEGYRPGLRKGLPTFKLKPGPLLSAAKRAREEPDARHFLVIDELNRGNLAKVFGELYFLLEYRNRAIPLQYSDKQFSLPENLYLIGTMNTADRSIALVDLALRRRFCFVEFHPDKPPINGLLRRWLRSHELEQWRWVADVVEQANKKLGDDRHAAIGPSYFMDNRLYQDDEDAEANIKLVWEHSVLPYVEEHLFGPADRMAEFDLDDLRAPRTRAAEGGEGEASEGADDT